MKIVLSLKIFKLPDFSKILDEMLKFPDFFRFSSLRSNPDAIIKEKKKKDDWQLSMIYILVTTSST